MQIRIDRTRMAMDGQFYAYDVLVPVAQLDRSRLNYFIVSGGETFVSLADATRPAELDAMPRGWARYDAFMAHVKACESRQLELAQSVYPELCGLDKWPALFIEVPGLEASHGSKWVTA